MLPGGNSFKGYILHSVKYFEPGQSDNNKGVRVRTGDEKTNYTRDLEISTDFSMFSHNFWLGKLTLNIAKIYLFNIRF